MDVLFESKEGASFYFDPVADTGAQQVVASLDIARTQHFARNNRTLGS